MKDECLCEDCDYANCICGVCRSRKRCFARGCELGARILSGEEESDHADEESNG